MDFQAEEMGGLREQIYFQVTDLLIADVSVNFYDTTWGSFELDHADPEREGLHRFGESKKRRPNLPQIVLALAINRDGLPVRRWVFPGNRVDVSTVEEVSEDLAGLRRRRRRVPDRVAKHRLD